MTDRVSLPSDLSGAVLQRSGEGVTFNRTAAVPPSTAAARTLSPTRAPVVGSAANVGQPQEMQQAQGNGGEQAVAGRGFNFDSMTIIWLIIVPIIVWIILFTWKPNFVTDLVNGERVINTSKLLLWTIIIGVIILTLLWLIFVAWPKRQQLA